MYNNNHERDHKRAAICLLVGMTGMLVSGWFIRHFIGLTGFAWWAVGGILATFAYTRYNKRLDRKRSLSEEAHVNPEQ